ncbi:hypothetical protein V2I80_11945 [Pseudomonas viridiflava]|uniref:hypothetical protein n=1 Tax=Pseudomonas viridiflava TaxID=33069 RepID=UPI002ECB9746|nr:hypothetical protein [Pseudomonas viridiflava]MEE3972350.1 hypothetical protein [Pseudomonas viridiflava]MEE4017191.1 hypothetical protein [Pseudomonas viridiflava]MEE4046157.1 hypothetical protein [Pseudomonas viridiflava]
MQAQHIIILTGLIVGFLLLTVFVERAIRRALHRSYWAGKSAGVADSSARLDALNADIAMLARRRERERRGFLQSMEIKNLTIKDLEARLTNSTTCLLTPADLQVLLDTATTLDLAHKTWSPMKGTEPWRARAASQLSHLEGIAHRTLVDIRATDRLPVTTAEAAGGAA